MKPVKSSAIDDEIFERQVMICKAFANCTRLHILDLLGKGNRTARDLQNQLGISKANLSQHMTVLKAAGTISRHRSGKTVYFALAMPEVKQACELIRNVLYSQFRQSQHFLTCQPARRQRRP